MFKWYKLLTSLVVSSACKYIAMIFLVNNLVRPTVMNTTLFFVCCGIDLISCIYIGYLFKVLTK